MTLCETTATTPAEAVTPAAEPTAAGPHPTRDLLRFATAGSVDDG